MSIVAISRLLLLPPLSLFLLYGIGLMLRNRRIGRTLSASAIALLFFLSTQAGAWLVVHPLENLATPLASGIHSDAQAIVVLAAGRLRSTPEYGNQSIPDYIALARLRYTAKLHHETGLPVLASGGVAIPEDGIPPLSSDMAIALQNEFVTPVRWLEGRSRNTAENAQYSAQVLKKSGINRILLVTDAMHMYRAKMMFEREGLEVAAAPTMFFTNRPLGLSDLIPGVEGLRRSNYATYEWLGIAWYRVNYWI